MRRKKPHRHVRNRQDRSSVRVPRHPATDGDLERRLRRQRWVWLIGDLVVAILVMLVSERIRTDVSLSNRIRAHTPAGIYELAGSVILFTTVYRFLEIVVSFKRALNDDAYAVRIYRVLAFMEALRVAAFMVLLMYGAGAIDAATTLLARSLAFLSDRASYVISTVLGWIISGVIGNFAYDLLKRPIASRRSVSSPLSRFRRLAKKA